MPVPDSGVPLVPDDFADELFFAFFEDFADFFALLCDVEPEADVSPVPVEPVPAIEEPDEPLMDDREDFADFLCM